VAATPSIRDLEALRQFTSPTLANALELLGIDRADVPFMSPAIRCFFPEFGPVVGNACTATIMTEKGASGMGDRVPYRHWKRVTEMPLPRLVVVQDMDQPPARYAWWGEVNGNIHKALGCAGLVTNGGVRDLDEVRGLGFHFFAAEVVVAHGYAHLVDHDIPVKIGGIWVRPGDVLHADRHGVLRIPVETVRELPAAAAEVAAKESRILRLCQSSEFTVERLRDIFAESLGLPELRASEH
jgi:regulator of RNase E activity RraA